MNTPNLNRFTSNWLLAFILVTAIVFSGCKKDEDENAYSLEAFGVKPPYSGKNKEKTPEQYVSVLYASLFQKGISTKQLADITEAMYSVGDKQLAREMVVSDFLNDPNVILPTNTEMRADLDKFLEEAYKDFYVRNITESERAWFKKYINENQEITVELVYASFALSNEYQFY